VGIQNRKIDLAIDQTVQREFKRARQNLSACADTHTGRSKLTSKNFICLSSYAL